MTLELQSIVKGENEIRLGDDLTKAVRNANLNHQHRRQGRSCLFSVHCLTSLKVREYV